MVNKENFQLYKHAWIDKRPPHCSMKISEEKISRLLKSGGVMVRNTYDFDCGYSTFFWYVIKDTFEGIEGLSTKMRNQIRKSLKTYDFVRVSAAEMLSVGLPVYQEACKSYRVKVPIISQKEFEERIENCEKEGATDYWCAYRKDTQECVALAINTLHHDCCEYNTMKCLPSAMHNSTYPYYGLLFEMNRYYLDELKLKYVNDGARSITEHSNIQPFLIEKFNFRKAYCKLQLSYKWWMRLAVNLLYPFRNVIPYPPVKAILRMEEMARKS